MQPSDCSPVNPPTRTALFAFWLALSGGCGDSAHIRIEASDGGNASDASMDSAAPMGLRAEVEDGEWLAGGETTVTLLLGRNAFSFPASNLTDRETFSLGDSFFTRNWITAPARNEKLDGLGPTFNSRGCAGCHARDGRGQPPAPGETAVSVLIRLSIPGTDERGGPLPDPNYGGQIQPFALVGVTPEANVVVSTRAVKGAYANGTSYELLEPTYEFPGLAFGPLHENIHVSPRVAPAMIGLGLLEAIPESRLVELADEHDEDGDGISGRVNRVYDVTEERMRTGRFGWKAEQPSLLQQNAAAFLGDIGITSRVFPDENCPAPQVECEASIDGGSPEIEDALLDAVTFYSRTLAVPVRRDWEDPEVLRGKFLFQQAGCDSCHVPRHVTSASASLDELSEQTIWPYTDLLLHDMGDALSDDRPVFSASGREWRTPPLWGAGLIEQVNGHLRLLHDGRARGFAEAILWHGGEAEDARETFRALSAGDRSALIRFLESL